MFTNRFSRIFFAVFVFAVAFATVSFAVRPAPADGSYDLVEQARETRSLSSPSTLGYDKVEAIRLHRIANMDGFYDSIEQARASRSLASFASGYDQVEALRLQWKMSPLTAASGYDLIEQLRATRGIQADRSYDPIETLRLEP